VVVTDLLPAGVTFVATYGQGTCSGTSTIVCALGTLGPGEEAVVQIDVRADVLGLVTDTASVTSSTPDNNLTDNRASITTAIENTGPVQLRRPAVRSHSTSRPPA
jgi:hypothetical protein